MISTWWMGGRALLFMPKMTRRPLWAAMSMHWASTDPDRVHDHVRPERQQLVAARVQLVRGDARPSAPSASATGARSARGSTTMTGLAPDAARTAVNRQPMAPAPNTTADLARPDRGPLGAVHDARERLHERRDLARAPRPRWGGRRRRGRDHVARRGRRRGRCPGPPRWSRSPGGRRGTTGRRRTWGRGPR